MDWSAWRQGWLHRPPGSAELLVDGTPVAVTLEPPVTTSSAAQVYSSRRWAVHEACYGQ